MIKNVSDVIFGGLSYWMFGYGISFGDPSFHGLFGTSRFFLSTNDSEMMGYRYAHFFFQSSFATTATTIVSGAMAERANFNAYLLFSFFNTLVYAFPAHWIWHPQGFLKRLGAIDFAGSGAVHLIGGLTGLVATVMMGARHNRWSKARSGPAEHMGNPINAILGMFMLWWGWLGFNCGSTYGVAGGKWKLAAKAAVTTINSSIAAGCASFTISYIFKRRKFDIGYIINGILGGLVGITSICPAVSPGEALVIGAVSACVTLATLELLLVCRVDDPVGAIAVHGAAGTWSLIAVGFFASKDPTEEKLVIRNGLLHGGDVSLLYSQLLYVAVLVLWTGVTTFSLLAILNLTIGIRCDLPTEVFGADLCEHSIGGYLNQDSGQLFNTHGYHIGTIHADTTPDQLRDLYCKLMEESNTFDTPCMSNGVYKRSSTLRKRMLTQRRVSSLAMALNSGGCKRIRSPDSPKMTTNTEVTEGEVELPRPVSNGNLCQEFTDNSLAVITRF